MRAMPFVSRSFFMALSLAFTAPLVSACNQSQAQEVAQTQTIKIAIEGMTCDGCAQGIHGKVSKLEGVSETLVSFKDKAATVTFNPSKVTETAILEAIKQAGYTAKVAVPTAP